jgi:hypothetical protein
LVGDSDSSDADANETPSKPQKKGSKANVPLNIAVHKPKTNGVSKKAEAPVVKKKDAPKEKTAPKKAATPKKAVSKPAPEESNLGTDSSEESDASVQSREYPSKKDGAKEVSSSSEEESSESASDSDSDSSSGESEDEEASPAAAAGYASRHPSQILNT